MKILMLDKNTVTDRRIILEAKSLIENEHEVIIYGGRNDGNQPEEINNKVKIKKFFYNEPLETKDLKYIPASFLKKQNEFLIYKKKIKSKFLARSLFFLKNPVFGLIKIQQANYPLLNFFLKFAQVFFSLASGRRHLIYRSLLNINAKRYWVTEIYKDAKKNFYPEVIHCHDFTSLEDGIYLSKKFQIPLIYDAHELYSYQPGLSRKLRKKIYNKERKLIHFANACITVNQQQTDIMRRDFKYNNFTPIANATESPKEFLPNEKYDFIRKYTGISDNEPIILFQGLVNRLRKIDLLMEGLSLVDQKIHLVFLAYNYDDEDLTNLSKNLKIEDRVHFLPPVPWEDMIFWAASADVGILPYQADDLNTKISSPNKLYEFICAATPMIGSSDLINVNEIIEKEGFGVTYPLKEAKDYAAAIQKMFDPILGGTSRFKTNLLNKRHLYLWEHEEKKLLKVYKNLMSNIIPLKN